jgi:hypothetical protein
VGALVLLPLRRCCRPLCSPHVVGRVREGISWMAIASSDWRLGRGVSLREDLSPTGQPPSGRCLWSSRARRDGPPPFACASASTDAAAANNSPANLARISSCHELGGEGRHPMGSPEHGSPKRRATSSKFTAISPRGNGRCVSRNATSPVHRPASSRTQSATCAPPGAKRPA